MSPASILAVALGSAALALSACGPAQASLTKTAVHEAGPRTTERVEVLLDREPDRPFRVVGVLHAKAIESPMSIEIMRAEAAKAGFDGIYWIDCATPRSGRCTAKGYVYESPVTPTKPAPGDTVIASK